MVDKPSASNKNWVRAAAVAATVAAASRGTAYLPAAGIAFVHLLAYAVNLGAIVWTTFIAASGLVWAGVPAGVQTGLGRAAGM